MMMPSCVIQQVPHAGGRPAHPGGRPALPYDEDFPATQKIP